jgi:hypothetical protein
MVTRFMGGWMVNESETRKSTFGIASFGLVASVCGGGILSLPLAFARAGIIPTTVRMIYGALTTYCSLFYSSTRRARQVVDPMVTLPWPPLEVRLKS